MTEGRSRGRGAVARSTTAARRRAARFDFPWRAEGARSAQSPVRVGTGGPGFTLRGRPIVGAPEDALGCVIGTKFEGLPVGGRVLKMEERDPGLVPDQKGAFGLDR